MIIINYYIDTVLLSFFDLSLLIAGNSSFSKMAATKERRITKKLNN